MARASRPSRSSRRTRACRSSIPSPRKSPASIIVKTAVAARGGLYARRARHLTQKEMPRAARLRDPGPHQHGIDGCGWHRQALGRHAHRIRDAVGPGCARRYVRLCGLHHQSEFRFVAGQADRAFADRRILRMRSPRPIARCASSGSRACRPTSRFLQSLLRHPEFIGNRVYTRFIEDNIAELVGADDGANGHSGCSSSPATPPARRLRRRASAAVDSRGVKLAIQRSAGRAPSWQIDAARQLRQRSACKFAMRRRRRHHSGPRVRSQSPRRCRARSFRSMWPRATAFIAAQQLFVMEAMKMEHVIHAQVSGIVRTNHGGQRRCGVRGASARVHRGG